MAKTTKEPTRSPGSSRDRTAHKPLVPFTVDHWRALTRQMVLDNGEYWEPEDFQTFIVEELIRGRDHRGIVVGEYTPVIWTVIPEGNAKTTLAANVALYFAGFKRGARVPIAAAAREQARTLYGQAEDLIANSPGFARLFRVTPGFLRITAVQTGGEIQVKAADDRTGDGIIPDCGILEELHRHRTLRLSRTWRGKLDKRDGILWAISTAGAPGSEFEEVRRRMHKTADVTREVIRLGSVVRSSTADNLILDWRVPPKHDHQDMAVVKRANPLATITEAKLARRRRDPQMTLEHWLRMVCDIASNEAGGWLENRDGWDLGGRLDDVDEEGNLIPAGADVTIMYDPAYLYDRGALVALEPIEEWRRCRVQPVRIFHADEFPGGAIEDWAVAEEILRAAERWRVTAIGYDFHRGFIETAQRLSDQHGLPMVRVPMNSAVWAPLTKGMRGLINSGGAEHPEDPEFTAHVLSGETKDTPHGPRLHGRTSEKVDALIGFGGAAFLAWGTYEMDDEVTEIYQGRDLITSVDDEAALDEPDEWEDDDDDW